MGTFEYIGFFLIILGVIYIFLQGLGKLSDKGGEIETKILSLKGGAGLILVALGIILLALSGGLPLPIDLKEKLTIVSTPIPTIKRLSERPSFTPSSDSIRTVLSAIDKESGYINSEGLQHWDFGVGDRSENLATQAFLSFNIAEIPANAEVTAATLDFNDYSRREDPFQGLGCLNAYEYDYGAPDASDFFFGTPKNAIDRWCLDGDLSEPLPSSYLMSALQRKLGQSRFQIRLQFDKSTDNDGRIDDIKLNTKKLVVLYTVP